MSDYNEQQNEEIMESMSESINYVENKAKNRVKREIKKQTRRATSKLAKNAVKAGAKVAKAIGKAVIATIKAILPYLAVIVGFLAFIALSYFIIFEFTGTEKEYIKEYENKIERREDGVYITKEENMNKENKVIRDYYIYFAGQSFWKLINNDNETLFSPDEKKEVKDEYGREDMFLLPPNMLFSLDEYMYRWQFKYAEQFIKPINYDKKELKLLSLTDDEGFVIAESDEENIETGEKTGNKITSVRDYGLASVLKYNEKDDYKKTLKVKGEYIAEDIWNPVTKEVETITLSVPREFEVEMEPPKDIWLIDKAILFTGEIEYEYEYKDEKIGDLKPGVSDDESKPVTEIIMERGVDPNCELHSYVDKVTGELITEEICGEPIYYELKAYRSPESMVVEEKPVVVKTITEDKGQDYFYDYLYNFESYVPEDALTEFNLEDRIDYDSYIFDYEGILNDDYAFEIGGSVNTDKFKYAYDMHMDRVKKYSNEFGVDPYIIMAIMTQESGGRAKNPDGTPNKYGIMQIYGGDREITTTNAYGDKETVYISVDEKKDADKSVRWATAYYKYLLDLFEGDNYKAIQAYNLGEGTILRIKEKHPEAWNSNFGWLIYREESRRESYPNTPSASYKCMAFPEGVSTSSNNPAGDSCFLENVLQYYNGQEIEQIESTGNSAWDKLVSFGKAFMGLLIERDKDELVPKIDFINHERDSIIQDVLMTTRALNNGILFSESDDDDVLMSLKFWDEGFMDMMGSVGLNLEELLNIAPNEDGYLPPINMKEDGGRVSSRFGPRKPPTPGASSYHKGVDIAVYQGAPIYAIADGIVKLATYSSSAGNYVIIDHGNGVESAYMHTLGYFVKAGDEVKRGDNIAQVGSTGVSTGPHLHFEIRVNGIQIDPISVVLIGLD